MEEILTTNKKCQIDTKYFTTTIGNVSVIQFKPLF